MAVVVRPVKPNLKAKIWGCVLPSAPKMVIAQVVIGEVETRKVLGIVLTAVPLSLVHHDIVDGHGLS